MAVLTIEGNGRPIKFITPRPDEVGKDSRTRIELVRACEYAGYGIFGLLLANKLYFRGYDNTVYSLDAREVCCEERGFSNVVYVTLHEQYPHPKTGVPQEAGRAFLYIPGGQSAEILGWPKNNRLAFVTYELNRGESTWKEFANRLKVSENGLTIDF